MPILHPAVNKTTSPILGITLAGVLALTVLLGSAHAITIDFVPVGNPGNANDTTGFGGVSTSFRISTSEVTNAQYAAFLNTVDPAGANALALYSTSMGADVRSGISLNGGGVPGARYELKLNMGNKPVNYVSFLDVMRFANWLHNGQIAGGTETGAYTVASGGFVARSAGATVWIPTENEWYKAAYYDPVSAGADGGGTADYWLYPTQSDSVPTMATANVIGDVSNPGSNVVNYNLGADWNSRDGNVTTVGGALSGSASHYGTFDQGGNVFEWNEAVLSPGFTRGLRGGAWDVGEGFLQASSRLGDLSTNEFSDLGFRIATVPEPSVAVSVILGAGLMLSRRKRPLSFSSFTLLVWGMGRAHCDAGKRLLLSARSQA